MIEFEETIEARCVRAERQERTGDDGVQFKWMEADFLRLDKPQTLNLTVGDKALNGAVLEPGGEYRLKLVPKAVNGANGRAFIARNPRVVAVEVL